MSMIQCVARLVALAASTSIAVVPIADASPALADQPCQFSGGVGPNAACRSAPQDDYSDIYWLYYHGFFGDNVLPGVSGGFGGPR